MVFSLPTFLTNLDLIFFKTINGSSLSCPKGPKCLIFSTRETLIECNPKLASIFKFCFFLIEILSK